MAVSILPDFQFEFNGGFCRWARVKRAVETALSWLLGVLVMFTTKLNKGYSFKESALSGRTLDRPYSIPHRAPSFSIV